jgi:hypothetical protein
MNVPMAESEARVRELMLYKKGYPFTAETLAHYTGWTSSKAHSVIKNMLRKRSLALGAKDGTYAKPVDSRKWLVKKWASGETPRPWRPL